jgi:hypothetical protein
MQYRLVAERSLAHEIRLYAVFGSRTTLTNSRKLYHDIITTCATNGEGIRKTERSRREIMSRERLDARTSQNRRPSNRLFHDQQRPGINVTPFRRYE